MKEGKTYFVYILRSRKFPKRIYTGHTENIKNRIRAHNNGECVYTKNFKPWKIICLVCFPNKKLAINFEKYLKTGSGVAFARKHLIN
jgi:predicted GIY-YIG superfamily endonuclease